MTRSTRSNWRHRTAAALIAMAATLAVGALLPQSVSADTGSLAGTAGTTTDLPATDSAVTVSGRGAFATLKIRVNQTRDLVNQAISVSWTGGIPTGDTSWNGKFKSNFLQIFQCWGNDDGTNPANPGPPPEKCEFGAEPFDNAPAHYPITDSSEVYSRVIGRGISGVPNPDGFVDTNGLLWKPFNAVDGEVVNAERNPNITNFTSGAFWLNDKFSFNDTNEIDFAATHPDSTGSELFQADTGLEASGLGCGQKVELQADRSTSIPKCWLVIVPRSTPQLEVPGVAGDVVSTSPLTPAPWSNRIAIPLDFNPIGTSCTIGADERRMAGSELATPAVTNWQPALCASQPRPFSYSSVSDDQARRQLVSGVTGAPGMAVVSRPLDPATIDPANPVVYAPIALSAAVIGFNIERTPGLANGGTPPVDEQALRGVRVGRVNLTPRLVAKLLTESYPESLARVFLSAPPPGYDWVKANPLNMGVDPDFLQYNPEFALFGHSGQAMDKSSLVVEEPTSDAANVLWQWILTDPEALAWLNGQPDQWGMKVNPVYSTSPAVNPSHVAFGSPTPNSFPKSDAYCYPEPFTFANHQHPSLCITDVSPYAFNMQVAAQEGRVANDGAKTVIAADNSSTSFGADGPQVAGSRWIGAVTDAASAARYGLQSASLSRSGDDGADRSFVSPDQGGLLAGAEAMGPSSVPGVLQTNTSTTDPGAYPLAMLTYAAVTPGALDATARADYSAFVTYAAGPGQSPGSKFGQLPPGYAPLPTDLRTVAVAAASTIRTWTPAPATTTTAATTTTTIRPTTTAVVATSSVGAHAASAPLSTPPGSARGPASGGAAAPSTTPAKNPATSVPKRVSLVLRTPSQGIGSVRYTLPIATTVGLLAAIGAPLVRVRRRKTKRPDLTDMSPGSG